MTMGQQRFLTLADSTVLSKNTVKQDYMGRLIDLIFALVEQRGDGQFPAELRVVPRTEVRPG